MSSQQEPLGTHTPASAELSLDIARVVSRLTSGEAVDTAGAAAALAAKYPMLGMTGAMIEEAISRAAGMIDMIRAAPATTETAEELPANGSPPDLPEAAFDALDWPSDDAADGGFDGFDEAAPGSAAERAAHNGFSVADGSLLARGANAFRRAFFRR